MIHAAALSHALLDPPDAALVDAEVRGRLSVGVGLAVGQDSGRIGRWARCLRLHPLDAFSRDQDAPMHLAGTLEVATLQQAPDRLIGDVELLHSVLDCERWPAIGHWVDCLVTVMYSSLCHYLYGSSKVRCRGNSRRRSGLVIGVSRLDNGVVGASSSDSAMSTDIRS